jgi:molybdenum cofactor guanylyltransferase
MGALLGAVLCGGASTRMGVDKATMAVGGVAMARRVADAMDIAGCSPVVAIGGDPAALARIGLTHVADQFPGEGPLGGILTALSLSSSVVVAACDLANLRAATIGELIDALGDHDAAIAHSGQPQPLCAVWTDRAAGVLRTRFQSGERAVHRALAGLDIAWVTVSSVDVHNVNTPGDLGNL